MKKTITLEVNGVPETVEVEVGTTLLRFLRDGLDLTGAKEGCNEGECGSCMVLLDGRPVNSCLVLAVEADGRSVTTIEGLAQDDVLHPLQKAFLSHAAIQCGFCTPGMIISAAALLREKPEPSEDDVRKALAGNLCRCTGYRQIVDAVHAAAARDEDRGQLQARRRRRRREECRARGGDGVTAARSVGTDVPRVDGLEKVTGAAQYTADLKFPRLLHVAVVRSPHPHARVLDVRTEKASRMPGVRAVVSGRDFPLHTGIYLKDQTVFATDRVRFVGDPVAAVAAETPEAAADAAALVAVDYEPLPPIFDVEEGMAEGAPLVHPDLGSYEVVPWIRPKSGTNVCNHLKIRKGDYASALRRLVEGLRERLPRPAGPARPDGAARLRRARRPRGEGRGPHLGAEPVHGAPSPLGLLRALSRRREGPRAVRRRRLRREGGNQPRADRRRARHALPRPVGAVHGRPARGVLRDGRAAGAHRHPRHRRRPERQGAGPEDALPLELRRLRRLRREHRPLGGLHLRRRVRVPQRRGRQHRRLHEPPRRQRLPRLRDAGDPLGARAADGQGRPRARDGPGRVPAPQLPGDGKVDRHRAGPRRARRARRPLRSQGRGRDRDGPRPPEDAVPRKGDRLRGEGPRDAERRRVVGRDEVRRGRDARDPHRGDRLRAGADDGRGAVRGGGARHPDRDGPREGLPRHRPLAVRLADRRLAPDLGDGERRPARGRGDPAEALRHGRRSARRAGLGADSPRRRRRPRGDGAVASARAPRHGLPVPRRPRHRRAGRRRHVVPSRGAPLPRPADEPERQAGGEVDVRGAGGRDLGRPGNGAGDGGEGRGLLRRRTRRERRASSAGRRTAASSRGSERGRWRSSFSTRRRGAP